MNTPLSTLKNEAQPMQTTRKPLVSIFMSAYNAGAFLRESVNSILAQTFEDFEFVIVNDGSTDDSAEYLDSITDPRVIVIHQENKGLGKPQNQHMKSCRGKYIVRMDADDISAPTRIAKQFAVLEHDPDLIMVGCYFQFFGPSGNKSPVSKQPTSHQAILSGMLSGWHTMAHATVMFRRSLLDNIEGYLICGAGEDWTLLLDAARFGKYAMVPESLYEVRLHSTSNAWKGAEKVAVGFEFARRRHQAFMNTKTDLSVEQFFEDWKKVSFIKKLKIRFAAYSSVLHRQAILGRTEGQVFFPYVRLALASLLNPSKAVGAIWKRLQSSKQQEEASLGVVRTSSNYSN